MGTGVNTLIMMGLLLEDFYALAKRPGAVALIVSHYMDLREKGISSVSLVTESTNDLACGNWVSSCSLQILVSWHIICQKKAIKMLGYDHVCFVLTWIYILSANCCLSSVTLQGPPSTCIPWLGWLGFGLLHLGRCSYSRGPPAGGTPQI